MSDNPFEIECPDLQWSNDNGVFTITIARQDGKGNALSQSLIKQLSAAFNYISTNPDIRMAILQSGLEKYFCAGVDVREMEAARRIEDLDERRKINYQQCKALADLFETMAKCPKPIIGAAQGFAVGGGATLLALCDWVIADKDKAVFSYPEKEFDMLPWVSAPYLMRRVLDNPRLDSDENMDGYSIARQYLNGAPDDSGIGKNKYQWDPASSYDWGVVDDLWSSRDGDAFADRVKSAAHDIKERIDREESGKRKYSPPPAYEPPVIIKPLAGPHVERMLVARHVVPVTATPYGEERDEVVEKMIQFITAYQRLGSDLTPEQFKEHCINQWCDMRCKTPSEDARKYVSGVGHKKGEANAIG